MLKSSQIYLKLKKHTIIKHIYLEVYIVRHILVLLRIKTRHKQDKTGTTKTFLKKSQDYNQNCESRQNQEKTETKQLNIYGKQDKTRTFF